MKPFGIVVVALLVLLPPLQATKTKGWRGIVPLRSTRDDVEMLLGEGTNECKCSYYRDDMNIFFDYSSGDCASGGSGNWNIEPNTVIRFSVIAKPFPKLSDLKFDESRFEKHEDIGNTLVYVDAEEGFSMFIQLGVVTSFNYGPSAGDENLRCPNYDGVHYSSDIPGKLRPRLIDRLNQYVRFSSIADYENLYDLFLPAFAARMFDKPNKREFAKWVRKSGPIEDTLIEFRPDSITLTEDKEYGRVYEVFGITKTSDGVRIVEGYRATRLVLKGGEFYFVGLFRLLPR